jgi:mRNA-degrading endonuclease toxin of MazEF toxin-antitoxin module
MCDQIKAVDKRRLQKQHACGSITDVEEREAVVRALRELVTITV